MNHAEFRAELRERELYNSQETGWRERTSIKHKFWIIYRRWVSPRETPPRRPVPDSLQTDSAVGTYSANEKSLSCVSEQRGMFISPLQVPPPAGRAQRPAREEV